MEEARIAQAKSFRIYCQRVATAAEQLGLYSLLLPEVLTPTYFREVSDDR
jgi:hypothetical protein